MQLWRNKFLSLSTVFLGALIIFLINFVLSIEYYADESLRNLEQKADFTVALDENYDVFDFEGLQNDLKRFEITTETRASENMQGITIPKRLHIQFKNLREVSEVFKILKSSRYASVVGSWDGSGESDFVRIIDQLLKIRKTVDTIGLWMMVIFIIGGSFLVINTFRMVLFSRKEEIFIARLVGAEHRFISWPFIFEGLLIGILACIIGIVAFVFALREIYFFPGGDIFVHLFNNHIFSYELYISAGVGAFGAFVSVRRYLFGRFAS